MLANSKDTLNRYLCKQRLNLQYHYCPIETNTRRQTSPVPIRRNRTLARLHADIWVQQQHAPSCTDRKQHHCAQPFQFVERSKSVPADVKRLACLQARRNKLHRDSKASNADQQIGLPGHGEQADNRDSPKRPTFHLPTSWIENKMYNKYIFMSDPATRKVRRHMEASPCCTHVHRQDRRHNPA